MIFLTTLVSKCLAGNRFSVGGKNKENVRGFFCNYDNDRSMIFFSNRTEKEATKVLVPASALEAATVQTFSFVASHFDFPAGLPPAVAAGGGFLPKNMSKKRPGTKKISAHSPLSQTSEGGNTNDKRFI